MKKRWLANTAAFITNLAHGDLGHLLLQPHPGITTQWIGALTVFSDSWIIRKLPLVITQSILIGIAGYLAFRLWNKKTAIILTILFALNPLLIAHTRVYAMDSLLSIFLIISILALLLWQKTKASRYLVFSALASSAATLSKLPGIIMVPFSLALLIYWQATSAFQSPVSNSKFKIPHLLRIWDSSFRILVMWLTVFFLGLILILPSIAINPAGVLSDISSFFRSTDYLSQHQASSLYYLRSLFFFSTSIHFVAILTLPFFLYSKKIDKTTKFHLATLALFALLFTLQMSLGAKKGDRYILPTFLTLDVISALIISWLFSINSKTVPLLASRICLSGLIVLQAFHVYTLHPYLLAYINPITQPFFGQRRHGWGEGLDLAAQYLNTKPNSDSLIAASYYPHEFALRFKGQAVPAHQYNNANVAYVVLYRAMFERGPQAWETDVLNHYRHLKPEKTISLGGLPMVWIYNTKASN